MTLVLLYGDERAQRICEASSSTTLQFRQFLTQKKVFYSKRLIGALLMHHYRFLMSLSSLSLTGDFAEDISSWRTASPPLPVMHCLRADIQDVCGCCPWMAECAKRECTQTDCLGQLIASQLLSDVYQLEQRRLSKYVGPVIQRSLRYFYLLQQYCEQQKSTLFAQVNALALSGKDEGLIARACRGTLQIYQRELNNCV